jgi:hypothetical protein
VRQLYSVQFQSTVVRVGGHRQGYLFGHEGKTLALIHKLEDVHGEICCAWSGDDNKISDGVGRRNKAVQCCRRRQASEVHTWKPAEAQVGKPFDRVPVGGTQLGLTCFINAIFLFPSV